MRIRTAAACLAFAAGGCATLRDTEFLTERYTAQAARVHGMREREAALQQEIGGTSLVPGNRVTLLQDGPETYRAMLDAIGAARDHVNLESYIFEDGEIGQRFADLLVERQAHGVQVNIIYDSVGAFGTSPAFFERLRQAGIQVLEFNPVNPLAGAKAWTPNNRDHRKLLVVDGRTAFLGGINISSVYSAGSGTRKRDRVAGDAGGWRDTDVRIEGPVVADYQRLFMATWQKQGGAALMPRDYFPALPLSGSETVRAIGSTPDDEYSLIYLTLIAAITSA